MIPTLAPTGPKKEMGIDRKVCLRNVGELYRKKKRIWGKGGAGGWEGGCNREASPGTNRAPLRIHRQLPLSDNRSPGGHWGNCGQPGENPGDHLHGK